jgi:hypothetical protein
MPSGAAPPEEAGGLELRPLADAVVERYALEFPDEDERYEPKVWRAWCRHDTQYLLQWAVLDVELSADLQANVAWLARILAARDFPLDRLARTLELAADVSPRRAAPTSPPAARRHRRALAPPPAARLVAREHELRVRLEQRRRRLVPREHAVGDALGVDPARPGERDDRRDRRPGRRAADVQVDHARVELEEVQRDLAPDDARVGAVPARLGRAQRLLEARLARRAVGGDRVAAVGAPGRGPRRRGRSRRAPPSSASR